MAKNKSGIDIQEKDTKVKSKSKKTKVKDEPLESKVSQVATCNCQVAEPLDDVKVVGDNVKVDVEQSLIAASKLAEIDCRSYNHSDVVGGYIRRKRSI